LDEREPQSAAIGCGSPARRISSSERIVRVRDNVTKTSG